MGMTPMQLLWRVELPNAMFVIFGGIRTALAICVGSAPLVFLIGAGGLGELIFTGISLDELPMMMAGRWCFFSRFRQASAMTSALSPDRMMFTRMISVRPLQKAGVSSNPIFQAVPCRISLWPMLLSFGRRC